MKTETKRQQITPEAVDCALGALRYSIVQRLEQKGWGTFSSRHEILGIIAEEYDELVDAVRNQSLLEMQNELLDIAVGCVFAIACIDSNSLEW